MAIAWTKIKHDINGNPRWVCHFLNLNTEQDKAQAGDGAARVSHLYELAVARACLLGGKRYHTKSYGGGIVFQAYDPVAEIEPEIEKMLKA